MFILMPARNHHGHKALDCVCFTCPLVAPHGNSTIVSTRKQAIAVQALGGIIAALSWSEIPMLRTEFGTE